ncbi:hypothetical protein B7Y94_03030 [Candidatus Saccharibacteria bacterium 32-49-12]|nr:MAG: hypothetical protein B7Y94_03030 [Candidatus Saccharibacteria bacterium 32-49-12]
MNQKAHGFTIVELLIVIVVIGILAAISIVAYNGVSNQANDSAVKSDLRNVYQGFSLYRAEYGAYPVTAGELSVAGVSASKESYGQHYSGIYNLLYCRMPDGSGNIGLAARSKSGQLFTYTSNGAGTITASAWTSGSPSVCPGLIGISSSGGEHRQYFYSTSWASFVK